MPGLLTKALYHAARRAVRVGLTLAAIGGLGVVVAAQDAAAPGLDLSKLVASATPGEPATVVYQNRPITELRAEVLGRAPAERVELAVATIDRLVREGVAAGPITVRAVQGAVFVAVGGHNVLFITGPDADTLAGETIDSKAAVAAANLQVALGEAIELRTPRRIAFAALQALLATVVFVAALWGIRRAHQRLGVRISLLAARRLEELSGQSAELVRVSRASEVLRYIVSAVFAGLAVFIAYSWLTFSLRRFPYTRPWGESLRTFLFDRLSHIGLAIVGAAPNLFTVALILLLTRFAVRLSNAVFKSVDEGHLSLPYVHPDTAQPTRRLFVVLISLLGLVLSYPYLPGSNSDAFKGVSVFIGLVVSLGSSGIVNQMMSGLTITYSRALRTGDFVRIGEVEGTVMHLGALSTKVKTPRGEEITIPNAVVMSHVTTNYSRLAATEGVYVSTSVTIGYDTPWRQVRALLLLAAERTEGVRSTPGPAVRQTALQDFYVQYTLLVCLEQPHLRATVLDALHGHIQDAFNEYGVQIMSPNYEADPSGPKVVPAEQWYAAPAKQPGPRKGL